MAIVQKFLSLDSYYKSTSGTKIILNDLDIFSIDDIESVNNHLMTVYDSDVIDTVPTCDCGVTKGNYLMGKTCPECGTVVINPQDQLDPIMWMKVIDPTYKFINPHYWLMFKNLLHKKVDYLRWLTDTSYNPPIDIPPYIYGIKDIIVERTYLNFVNNIDKILIYLTTQTKFKKGDTYDNVMFLLETYRKDKKLIFSNYMPIVNKKLFVMENTSKGKFTNLTVSDMIDLVMAWIKTANSEASPRKLSNIMGSTVSKLANLYSTYYDTYISKKPGIFRKHIFGFRSHFTFRTVITSIPGRHNYDEIHVPWSVGVTAFRPHILNKLAKLGYPHKKADRMLLRAVKKYNPIIDEILQSLISSSPNGKLYVLIQRNR